jgi:hypothetical protein
VHAWPRYCVALIAGDNSNTLLFGCCSVLLQVAGDTTLELTLSQFWSSLGDSSVEVELSFHGLDAQPAAGKANPLPCALYALYGGTHALHGSIFVLAAQLAHCVHRVNIHTAITMRILVTTLAVVYALHTPREHTATTTRVLEVKLYRARCRRLFEVRIKWIP